MHVLQCAAPDCLPENLRLVSCNARRFTISWSTPQEDKLNGTLTEYVIQLIDESGKKITEECVDVTTLQKTIQHPHTLYKCFSRNSYKCKVAARTRFGIGPYSTVVVPKGI